MAIFHTERIDLDERFLNLHHSDIDQLDGSVIDRFRTFNGDLVAYLNAPIGNRIILASLATLVERAVDVKTILVA